jgi:hypothetical protein
MKITDKVLKHGTGLVVLRDVDYGRQQCFWLTPFTQEQLESWWQRQKRFECNPNGAYDLLYEVSGVKPPPHTDALEFPGQMIDATTHEAIRLWVDMSNADRYYVCNLCCETDSYLRRPDGIYIYHEGFIGEPMPNHAIQRTGYPRRGSCVRTRRATGAGR